MFYIYIIKNTKNKKVYVGRTNNLVTRWNQHKCSALNKTSKFYKAMRRIGVNYFYIEILERTNDEARSYRLERTWIRKLDSTNSKYGYNTSPGFLKKLTKKS